nr:MAG TPA: hypothetical protein [Bacteriophage sp.]
MESELFYRKKAIQAKLLSLIMMKFQHIRTINQ